MRGIQTYLKLRTWPEWHRMSRGQKDPKTTQYRVLRQLLQQNSQTQFGRAHHFSAIESLKQFQENVPVRRYAELSPYMAQIVAGQQGVCTQEPVTMLTRTSGTTRQPKLIPVTPSWERALTRMTKLWLSQLLYHLPTSLSGKILVMVSPALEGHTPSGIPYGAMSGLSVQRLPRWLQGIFAIPYEVCCLEHVDTRYFLAMRFAMAEQISLLATPNATTLLQLAKTANTQLEAIVRAIHDGTLGTDDLTFMITAPKDAHNSLLSRLQPNPNRARHIETALRAHPEKPLLEALWPGPKTIACWLGGSAGFHASKLAMHYGPGTCYDLGLLASEGRLTLPMMPSQPTGLLPLHVHVFEFFPAEERLLTESAASQQLLFAWELEVGKKYHIVMSCSNGLWRYAMDDIVEICAMHHGAPCVAFVRKNEDFLSITGEKLHSNQVREGITHASSQCDLEVWQYRCIANLTHSRHDVLVEFKQIPSAQRLRTWLQCFDHWLGVVNGEYAAKRASHRLGAPCLFVMAPGWSDGQMQADLRQGKREYQYKWQTMQSQWNTASQQAIVSQIQLEKAP